MIIHKKGSFKIDGDFYIINGTITYNFSDEFTDPTDIRDKLIRKYGEENLPKWLLDLTNLHITPYIITGSWQTGYYGVARAFTPWEK